MPHCQQTRGLCICKAMPRCLLARGRSRHKAPPQQSRAAGPNAAYTGMPPLSRESVSKSFARPGLFVKRGYVVTCLLHHVNYLVKRNPVRAIGKRSIQVCVKGAGGSKRIALYARYLHKPANRVARHAKVVLKPHLGGIFNLRRAAPEQLAGRSRSHGTGNTHLTLAPHVGARDRSVVLDDVAYKPGRGYCVQYA